MAVLTWTAALHDVSSLGRRGPHGPPRAHPRGLAALFQEEEEQEEEDDDDDDDTDDLDDLDTDQLLEAELEEEDANENAGEEGDNDFSPSDEELANLLEEGEDGEDEDSDADEEVELILGDSKSRTGHGAEPGQGACSAPAQPQWKPHQDSVPLSCAFSPPAP